MLREMIRTALLGARRVFRQAGRGARNPFDFRGTYRDYVDRMRSSTLPNHRAMEEAIGGDFDAIGILERELLIQQGLHPDGCVIDVGCGSGRLARPLAEYLQGSYLGIDVVPALLAHARKISPKSF